MEKDLTLERLEQSLEKSKREELEKQHQIELESMNEFQGSLRASLTAELDLIKDDITTMQKSINKNNQAVAKNAEKYSKEIIESFQSMSKELTKMKAKQWIIPTAMGLALVLALSLGTWGVTEYLSHQLQALGEAKKSKEEVGSYQLVAKTYNNGIELKKKPYIWQGDNGNWVVIFEKSKGE